MFTGDILQTHTIYIQFKHMIKRLLILSGIWKKKE